MTKLNTDTLERIYLKLLNHFGPQHWWPGDTPFEVIVGAILTQNTNWSNVEKAIVQLKRENLLSPDRMQEVPVERLAQTIRPAGYFNVKAKRLKCFIEFIFKQYDGDLMRMKNEPLDVLRPELLSINGIGPETADSILLYAFDKPIFVVDAYTKRFLRRHNWIDEGDDYHGVQKMFMGQLPADIFRFNEYHALIVRLGKDFCKPSARCEECPLVNLHFDARNRCAYCHRSFLGKEERFVMHKGVKSSATKMSACNFCRKRKKQRK